MFELYDIYDTSEIMILVLFIVVILLVGIIIYMYSSNIGSEIKTVEEKILPKSTMEDKPDKKYETEMDKKGDVNVNQMKYSPSEFSTLLKYNPILPYSAFTWDIINNAYLDFNEQSNYDDRYFSLNNYDDIYKSYNEPLMDDIDVPETATNTTVNNNKINSTMDKYNSGLDENYKDIPI